MLRRLFGNDGEKPKKMTHEEALEILMENPEFREFESLQNSCSESLLLESLDEHVATLLLADKEIQNFNDASEIVSILKAMKLEAEKLVDPSDIDKINYNKRVREAIAVLTKDSKPHVTAIWTAVGAKSALLLYFVGAITAGGNYNKLDLDTRINLLFGGMGGGAIAGLVFSESGYRKRKEEDLANAKIEDILTIRNGISKKLELPESLATEVNQHIERVEYEAIFEKLDDSEKL
jgi:hypothetical protein